MSEHFPSHNPLEAARIMANDEYHKQRAEEARMHEWFDGSQENARDVQAYLEARPYQVEGSDDIVVDYEDDTRAFTEKEYNSGVQESLQLEAAEKSSQDQVDIGIDASAPMTKIASKLAGAIHEGKSAEISALKDLMYQKAHQTLVTERKHAQKGEKYRYNSSRANYDAYIGQAMELVDAKLQKLSANEEASVITSSHHDDARNSQENSKADDELGPDEEWVYVGGHTIPGTDEWIPGERVKRKIPQARIDQASASEDSKGAIHAEHVDEAHESQEAAQVDPEAEPADNEGQASVEAIQIPTIDVIGAETNISDVESNAVSKWNTTSSYEVKSDPEAPTTEQPVVNSERNESDGEVDFRTMSELDLIMKMGYGPTMAKLIKQLATEKGVTNQKELRKYWDRQGEEDKYDSSWIEDEKVNVDHPSKGNKSHNHNKRGAIGLHSLRKRTSARIAKVAEKLPSYEKIKEIVIDGAYAFASARDAAVKATAKKGMDAIKSMERFRVEQRAIAGRVLGEMAVVLAEDYDFEKYKPVVNKAKTKAKGRVEKLKARRQRVS